MSNSSNNEVLLINSVCKNKDIGGLLAMDIEPFFVGYGDVWAELKDYYLTYKSVPDMTVMKAKFGDLEEVAVGDNSEYYLNSLRQEFLSGQLEYTLLKASESMKTHSPEEVMEALGKKIGKLSQHTTSIQDIDLTDIDAATKQFETARERSLEMGGTVGIPTGFKAIDACYTTGMAPGHSIVVIGYTGKAKTFYTGLLAVQAWMQGFKPMIFSLEMAPEVMRSRIYASMFEGDFKISEMNRGNVNVDDFRSKAKKLFDGKTNFPVIAPEGLGEVTPNIIQGKIDKHQPDLVILDYLSLFSDNGRTTDPTKKLLNLSQEVKRLATRNQIPIVSIAAVTPGENTDQSRPPVLGQVAWSKGIAYDADLAMSIHRHEDSGLVEVTGLKNRHGENFNFNLEWDLNSGVWKESF